MADSRRPGLQLYTQLFTEEATVQNTGLQNLKAYLEDGGSIFPLVEMGVPGMVSKHEISVEEAQRFLHRANSMATYLSRQFIERELHAGNGAQTSSSGLLSIVVGPKYEDLFFTPFDRMCLPEALESLASPVAYLIDLLRWIRDRIEPYRQEDEGAPPEQFELHNRRRDLMGLLVDFNAVYQSVSSVDIIVSVLETFIATHPGTRGLTANASIEDALINARYPNGLPYYQHWVTIDGVAQLNDLSVGDFAHKVDKGYPYFLSAAAWTENAERALAHASRLGPYQRALLTEPAANFDKYEDFYQDNYGVEELPAGNLYQVPFFAEHTKLDAPSIERLLSIHEFAPVRSANVTYKEEDTGHAESARSGSVYINAHSHPGIRIDKPGSGPAFMHRLSVMPKDEKGFPSFDRMNRMVRLCNWLALPSDQVDALLVAATRAEERGGLAEGAWWITNNGVHALGLFQTLRERYNCSAVDFAAFIDQLGIYGRGEALSPFDQVFNNQGSFREPLKLDDGIFPVTPAPGEVNLTINQLCNGLGIDIQTYQYLAVQVASAHNASGTFTRCLPIISSFYRLVRLPRLLNLTPVEGVLMLLQLGGKEWLDGVARPPAINAGQSTAPDILQIITALLACVQWCEQSELPVLWMLQHAADPQPAREASEQDRQLFDQIRNLLPTAQFSNAGVLMAGLPRAGAADWLDFLSAEADGMPAVVDAGGLVLAPVGTPEDYLIDTRRRLEWAVDNALGIVEADSRRAMVDILLSVLLDARDAQESLVKQTLAVYAGVEVEQAIPILNWANTTVYRLLQEVSARVDSSSEPSARRDEAKPDPLLALLADVRRRSEVVSTLGLSAVLLQEYLDYGYDAWMGQSDKYVMSMQTLYHLTTLTRAFGLSTQPAQNLLDYLRAVHLAEAKGQDAERLLQLAAATRLAAFFGWSVQEVRECVERMDTPAAILKDLTQLALLMRVRELSMNTGMDALTIFLIGNLPEQVERVVYAEAAELALLSESVARAPIVQLSADLRQLVTTTCTVDKSEIVAGSTEKAVFTVTLKDADAKPLSGVKVHFRASLGHIETGNTQPDGTFTATYTPGTEMGMDTPVYWLDLFEPQNAPAINLTCDFESLEFVAPLMSPVPSEIVASGQEVELYVPLMDRFKNLGKNEWVNWTVEGGQEGESALIRPSRALTNQEGLARTFVSSMTGGEFTFIVTWESTSTNKSLLFDAITFKGSGTPQRNIP